MSIACCYEGCAASVCFTPDIERRMRRTHEWWVCPFGHRQHFIDQTESELRIEGLERQIRSLVSRLDERDEVFGTCPLGCGFRSRSAIDHRWLFMFKHLSKVHGNMLPNRLLRASRRENWPKSA